MMTYNYDKNFIKESLSIEQVKDIVSELGGDPRFQNGALVSRTICHGGSSHKLYYWDNTHLFKCFTDCGESFDLFELVRKVKTRETGVEWDLPHAIHFVAQYFGFSALDKNFDNIESIPQDDLTLFKNYDRINNIDRKTQIVELKTYDDKIIKNLPKPIIQTWIDDGISQEVMNHFEICYDPKNIGIVIPHRDIDGNLIGIRERTLIKENEKYGKYRPAKFYKQLYNHPLGFNLYGLNYNKQNIINSKRAVVFESKKKVSL